MRPIIILVAAITVFLPSVVFSQWEPTNGPYGGLINTMTMSGTTLFAGTNLGVYRSTDNGGRWVSPGLTSMAINAFGLSGTTVFAGTEQGVYRSTDNGVTWVLMSTGITNLHVNAFVTVGTTVFAGTDGGLYKTTNNGTQWISVGNFLNPVTHLVSTKSTAGSVSIFAGCSSYGLYQSKDNGATWTQLVISPPSGQLLSNALRGPVFVAANHIFAIAYDLAGTQIQNNTLCYSDYLGGSLSWQFESLHPEVSIVQSSLPNQAYAFVFDASTGRRGLSRGGVTFLSSGPNWGPLNYDGGIPACALMIGTTLFIGSERGILKSTDDGVTFADANQGMMNSDVVAVAMVPTGPGLNKLIAATRGGIFCSTNGGDIWQKGQLFISENLKDQSLPNIRSIVSVKNIAGEYSILVGGQNAFRSTDGGSTWEGVALNFVQSMTVHESDVYAVCGFAGTDGTVYRSFDSGLNWSRVATIHSDGTGMASALGPITSIGTSILVQGSGTIYRSTDGLNFHDVSGPGNIYDLAVVGKALFTSTSSYPEFGVSYSLDEGISWIETQVRGLPAAAVHLQSCGSRLFAATSDSGVYVSGDYGFSWKQVNVQLTNRTIRGFASDGTDIYVGTQAGVFHYTGSMPAATSLAPSVTGGIVAGKPFWVEVKIGDPVAVQNLQAVGFVLACSSPACELVGDSVVRGPFLATTLNKFTVIDGQTVKIALEQQPKPGKSGSGIVARIQFNTSANLSSSSDVVLSLQEVWAVDTAMNRMDLDPSTASYRIVAGGATVWPGDCNHNASVDVSDILPIGVSYGQTLGAENVPGALWQAYTRDLWPADSAKKKLYADANGDGVINSADLLPIGLNYGKRHQVFVKSGLVHNTNDGSIGFGQAVKKGVGHSLIQIPLRLKTLNSVFGIAFSVNYGMESAAISGSLKLTMIDTLGSVLGGELMLTHIFDEQLIADVGLSKTHGSGFVGDGQLALLTLDVPDGSSYWVGITNVVGNDEQGNPVYISGSTYHSSTATAIEEASVPLENALLQNYPNPFNPATTIRFQLAEPSSVSIKVFDLLGREVVALVGGKQPAGRFSIAWDASKVSSGIYYCRMTAQNASGHIFTQTQRMLLVK